MTLEDAVRIIRLHIAKDPVVTLDKVLMALAVVAEHIYSRVYGKEV